MQIPRSDVSLYDTGTSLMVCLAEKSTVVCEALDYMCLLNNSAFKSDEI